MPDGLKNDKERSLAWLASWHPSFSGKAIVDSEFIIISANPQFCKLLGITPAEIIGKNFADMTPEPYKTLDVENAKLVRNGDIKDYLIPKQYELSCGRRSAVTLLVVGVYDKNGQFMFFVSRIMMEKPSALSQPPSQKRSKLLDWIDPQAITMAILGAMGLAMAYLIEGLIK